MSLPRLCLALVALLCCALLPASARADFVALGDEPAPDSTAPEAGRDLTAVGVAYDRRSGALTAAFKLRGMPRDGGAFVTVVAARRTATGCDGAPAAGFSTFTDETSARWLRFASPTEVTASGSASKRGGTTDLQQITVRDRRLAGLRLDCALVVLNEPGNPANVYDTIGPLTLKPEPSLAVALGGLPETVRADRSYRLKVTLSNPGDAPTGRLRVQLAKARGLTATPRALTVRSLRAGHRSTATITVRLSAKAETRTDLRVRVAAGRLRAEAERVVYVRTPARPSPPSGGGGGGGGGGARTCVRWIPDFSGESGGSLGLVPC